MRLWHINIIKALPRQQLLSQWRELLAIKRTIDKQGTPNHILVNYVTNITLIDWQSYCISVYNEMIQRGYKVSRTVYNELLGAKISGRDNLLKYHNSFYLQVCFYNLTEKYICGGITQQEYEILTEYFGGII